MTQRAPLGEPTKSLPASSERRVHGCTELSGFRERGLVDYRPGDSEHRILVLDPERLLSQL